MKIGRMKNPLLFLSLLCVLLLSACEFRIHAGLTIEEDESGVLTVELSLDEELAALMGGEFGGELGVGQDMVPEGWTTGVVSEDGFEGILASATFESLDQLRERLGELADQTGVAEAGLPGFLSDITPTREEDTFRFRLVVPEEVDGILGEGLQASPIPLDLGMLDEVFDIRFTLVLPGDIVTTNADVVTGQTLVWKLSLTDSARVLEAESQLPGDGPTMIIVWVGLAAALLVVLYLVVRLRRRRRSTASQQDPDSPPGETATVDS